MSWCHQSTIRSGHPKIRGLGYANDADLIRFFYAALLTPNPLCLCLMPQEKGSRMEFLRRFAKSFLLRLYDFSDPYTATDLLLHSLANERALVVNKLLRARERYFKLRSPHSFIRYCTRHHIYIHTYIHTDKARILFT